MIKKIENIIRAQVGDNFVTVGILGDVSFHNISPSVRLFSPLIPIILNTDIAIANIETVISDKHIYPTKKGGIFLKSPVAAAKVLSSIGINIALLANNHIDDYGHGGILDTIHNLEEENIRTFGVMGKEKLNIEKNKISFELFGAVTPYANDEFLISYGKELESISDIYFNNNTHLLYFLHGFDELISTPFPWRVKLLKNICKKHSPAALICGHQHIYQGYFLQEGIPVCLSYGNGFLNIKYHEFNQDSKIGCFSILHFDKLGCFQIDEYFFGFNENGIYELTETNHHDRVIEGIRSIGDNESQLWNQECYNRMDNNKYNRYRLINLLYDIYRFIKLRKGFLYIHYFHIYASYIKKKWNINILNLWQWLKKKNYGISLS
jgi:hypothetical protein